MEEANYNFLLIELENLSIRKLKEIQALCENKIKERENKNDNNS